jgi:hypothetical protein
MPATLRTTWRALFGALAATPPNASISRALIGWIILLLGPPCILPTPVAAESSAVLESLGELEGVEATTFDKKGHAVGTSSFQVATEETGVRRMTVTMAIEGGGRNVSEAVLAPIADTITATQNAGQTVRPVGPRQSYRLLEQRAQATRADGVAFELLVIDHVKGRVSCYPPNRDLTNGRHIDLPEDDRVVNVTMPLLFLPLVTGEVDSVRFRVALCRDGPVLHKMIAVRGPKSHHNGRDVIEIRYGPDVGKAIAWFASRLLPKFSFWFDASDGAYLGHRMPLHRDGPDVVLVRQGLSPLDIGAD